MIAIFGPTASGKSVVAEAVADELGTEVVSADAMQVYRGLPILTNQPRRPTRLVAIRSLAEEMSVGAYASLAHEAIDELVATAGSVVVAGGTGLYLRAALGELDVPPPAAPAVRARVEREVDEDRGAAHERLASLDPVAAAAVHPNDRRRLVRALELADEGGSLTAGQDRLWSAQTRRPTAVVGLDLSARGARAENPTPSRGDVRARASSTRFAPPWTDKSRERLRRHSACARSPSSSRARPSHASSSGRDATPRTSASGCDASRASWSSTPAAIRPRWRGT